MENEACVQEWEIDYARNHEPSARHFHVINDRGLPSTPMTAFCCSLIIMARLGIEPRPHGYILGVLVLPLSYLALVNHTWSAPHCHLSNCGQWTDCQSNNT